MATFKKLRAPFSKYEMNETRTIIRNIGKNSIVGLESGSVRLYNDSKERVSIAKKDFETRLLFEDDTTPQPVIENANDDSGGDDSKHISTYVPPPVVNEQKEVKPKTEEMSKKKVKKPVAKKVAKVKAVKVKKEKTPKEDSLTAEQKTEVKAIVKGEGSKASKMKAIFKVTKSIQATADALDTHYSYVYNKLVWYPANPVKKK